MGHFCVSLFALFGVYATAPSLHSGRGGGGGGVIPVGVEQDPRDVQGKPTGTEKRRERQRRSENSRKEGQGGRTKIETKPVERERRDEKKWGWLSLSLHCLSTALL